LLLVILLGNPDRAAAHAYLESSDPVAGAILPIAPTTLTLTFSERLESVGTTADLFDHLGASISGTSFTIPSDRTLVVTLPSDLANGTYSLVFSTLSRDDGHPNRGYLPFTVGTSADIRPISIAALGEAESGAPGWLRTTSRWVAYGGLLMAMAIWPIWSLVVAPPHRRRPQALRGAIIAARWVAFVAFAVATLGNILSLLSQTLERSGAFLPNLESTLLSSRFGDLWLTRMLLLGLLAICLAFVNWVRPSRHTFRSAITLLVSASLALPFSLNSHAAAQVTGRTFAIAADFGHLIAAAMWGGGVILLLAIAIRGHRNLDGSSRRDILKAMIPRFSFVAIASWIMLIITGAYGAWLQIGNLDAARATSYGNAFLLKLGLVLALLTFAATQFLIVARRLQHEVWNRRFKLILIAESVGVVAVLLLTGWMTAAPPAREAFANETAGYSITLAQGDATATLAISPGAAGPNHYQLTFAGNAPFGSEALLRVTPPDSIFDTAEIPLTSVGPNTWETHGSEFSLAGRWSIEAVIRKAGEFQWQSAGELQIAPEAPQLPGQPWRFGLNALAGLAMLVIGAVAAARAVTSPGDRTRRQTAGIGMAGLAIGAAFLLSARIEPPPAFALADDATLARGSAVYAQQCLACHGVTGQGNGPDAAGLPVPPADFTDPIHQLHSDASLAIMIQNGFPLTGMPAFADLLSPGELADVIAYLRSLGAGAANINAPSASDCTIDPRDVESLLTITSAEAPTFEPTVDWPIGNTANDVQHQRVVETVEQFVACSNAGDYERVLATSTLRYLAPQFATISDSARDASRQRASAPVPLNAGESLAIESIEPTRTLNDGRLATKVILLDPVNHPHRLEMVLILAEESGIWRIDETQYVETPPDQGTQIATWPMSVTAGDFIVTLNLGDASESGRSVRITLKDAAGQSVDGASGIAAVVPRGAGVPAEVPLVNIDPGVYFGYAPAIGPGAYVIDVQLTLPNGEIIETGFTFGL
jgi:copper transport protein